MKNYKRTKFACYYTYVAAASVFSLPPILFVPFHDIYGISYTLLGTLVLVNFCTQLGIDLVFSFFAKYFNVHKALRTMPLLTSLGLLIYAGIPSFFPQYAYGGLLLGTVIFSVAAGLGEVLLSPTVAALPSDNPERDMSILHSLYAYGVVLVVVVSTFFLKIFGRENWMYLTLFWALLPIISTILFSTSPLPEMDLAHSPAGGEGRKKNVGLILCVLCIFLGSAAENTMTNWISGYTEKALQISKFWGDLLGLTVFAVLMGLTRSWYAKYGKNITKMLLVGMIGSACCYLIAVFCPVAIISMIACILNGVFTAMLWPGTLILMEEKIAGVGVAAYALMAAGGDFGASVAPQLMGIIVDAVSASGWAKGLSETLALTTEQIGMKSGILTASAFPLLGVFLLLYMRRYFKKNKES